MTEAQPTPPQPSDKPVIVSTCGPALLPYWPLLMPKYDIVFTEMPTHDMFKKQGQPSMFLLDFMPQLLQEYVWNLICRTMGCVDWPAALDMFHWPGDLKREDLTPLVWKTVNEWAVLGFGEDPERTINVPRAIRYNMLQYIYLRLKLEEGEWRCNAENWVQGFVAKQLTEIIPEQLALNNLKARRRVVGLLCHEDVSNACNHYVQWARVNGIPSVHVAHGVYGNHMPDANEAYNVHRMLEADVMLVWNENQKAFICRGGVDPDRVIVTGSGTMDRWALMVPDREYGKRMLGLDPKKPLVVYIGTWSNRLSAEVPEEKIIEDDFRLFCEAFKLLPDWELLVKIHPGHHVWRQEWYSKIMQEMGIHGAMVEFNNELVLQAADVCFSPMGSTLDIEASIVNRPCVRFGDNWRTWQKTFFFGCARSPEGIANGIKLHRGVELQQWWQEERARMLHEIFHIVDGHRTERIMQILLERFKV